MAWHGRVWRATGHGALLSVEWEVEALQERHYGQTDDDVVTVKEMDEEERRGGREREESKKVYRTVRL